MKKKRKDYRVYNPERPEQSIRDLFYRLDGRWYWKDIECNRNNSRDISIPLGDSSQASRKKYLETVINGRQFKTHRLIYWLHTNDWPEVVDHIDGNPRNNLFTNLRAATKRQNAANLRIKRGRTHNVGKYVCKDGSISYRPQIRFMGKNYMVGTFYTEHEAIIASLFVRRLLHGEYYNIQI
ncbi:TPA: HNH endonuclease [Klebsiella aerogenes]|nr:HNH endonuclease [Klebsiella aerogenes]